jgi:signal peptidase I
MNTDDSKASAGQETPELKVHQTYRPWVSLVLSLFVTGLGQFLSGERTAGLKWFFGILCLQLLMAWALASSSVPGVHFGFAIGLVAFACWVWMLVKSWKRISRLSFLGWLVVIGASAVIYFMSPIFVRTLFQPFKVPTGGMEPAIRGAKRLPDGSTVEGDHVFVEKYAYWFSEPKRGDIIVFRTSDVSAELPPGEFFVKRVAGVAGDALSVKQGRLHVGDTPVSEPPSLKSLSFPFMRNGKHLVAEGDTYQVPTKSFFVVGDNTTNSFDSRFFGPVPRHAIIGRVSKAYWPWNRAGDLERR